MIKNKLKAFSVHLLLSIVIVSLVVSTIIYFWYPLDYLGITNFKDISLLIISIDLIMGPVLTFVVFNPNKKSLRFDLAVIAALQISALAYGSYFLYQGHPVFVTYSNGSFSLINAKLAKPEDAKYDEYKVTKLTSGNLAYAEIPKNTKQSNELLDAEMTGGAVLDERADLYKPFKQNIDKIVSNSLDSKKIFSDEEISNKTKSFIKKYGDNVENFAFLPLEGATKDAIIVLDRKSASYIGTIGTEPWKYAKK